MGATKFYRYFEILQTVYQAIPQELTEEKKRKEGRFCVVGNIWWDRTTVHYHARVPKEEVEEILL